MRHRVLSVERPLSDLSCTTGFIITEVLMLAITEYMLSVSTSKYKKTLLAIQDTRFFVYFLKISGLVTF